MSSLPPAAGPVTGQLVCRARSGATQTFKLKGEQTIMGRDPGLGVSVTMEGISRRHAKISFDGKSYWLEDLRSTNGTFLNGAPVGKDRLRHLDVITLGKKLDLLFVLRAAEERQLVKRQGIVRAALIPADAPDAPHEVGVGEITLGRSAACNVQAESGTVSKVHAHVRRTRDQLLVQDLGSSNGTFVNGARVSVAELRDGDVLSLAGVEQFQVIVELGEVTTSGSYSVAAIEAAQALERPRFSNAWKTRFEWDSEELKQIADAQQAGVAAAERTILPSVKPQPKPTQVKKPATAAPASAAGQPPAPAPPAAAAKPAASAPAPQQPVPAPPKPAVTPAKPQPPAAVPSGLKPVAPAPFAAPPRPPATVPQPPRAAAPTPPSPAAKAVAPSPPRLEPTVAQEVPNRAQPSAAPAPTPRIVEVRLSGGGYEVVATATGAHSLGRAKDANLRLDHPTVSRKHARVILSDDRSTAYLQDMGGANGTLLNGVELRELKPLQEGDHIRVGEIELSVSLKKV